MFLHRALLHPIMFYIFNSLLLEFCRLGRKGAISNENNENEIGYQRISCSAITMALLFVCAVEWVRKKDLQENKKDSSPPTVFY